MVYLFIGEDHPSKELQLKKIKQEFLSKGTEQFNQDILYGKELHLKDLQEKLFSLPVNSPKRLVVIKAFQDLKEEVRPFLLNYVKKPYKQVVLVLDADANYLKAGEFINSIARQAKVLRFKEMPTLNTFTLGRAIMAKKPDYALVTLNQLLQSGERPERILGGLRFVCEKDSTNTLETKKRIKLLLACDIEIKTGKLKPSFALEKLVVSLCRVTHH
jgi:DNA polymerase III delta subunit